MAYRNLDEFIARLELEGDVDTHRIDLATSSPKENFHPTKTRVLLIEDSVTGLRAVRNLFGTRSRVERGLRVTSLVLVANRLAAMLDLGKPGAFGALIGQAMALFSALRTTTNRRALESFQQLEPVAWTESIGRTLKVNSGYPLCATLMTAGATAVIKPVLVAIEHGRVSILSAPALEPGEQFALVFGGDPAFLLAGWTPLPDLIHRTYFASWLRERPLDMMRLPSMEIEVPSNSDAVACGMVTHLSLGTPNAFLDPDNMHLQVELQNIYTRPAAVYMLLGSDERTVISESLFAVFDPMLRRLLPGIREGKLRGFVGTVAAAYLAERAKNEIEDSQKEEH